LRPLSPRLTHSLRLPSSKREQRVGSARVFFARGLELVRPTIGIERCRESRPLRELPPQQSLRRRFVTRECATTEATVARPSPRETGPSPDANARRRKRRMSCFALVETVCSASSAPIDG